ncbi:MAG: hypothetical protein WC564_04850 [Patescibacteria group bacterium]|jgi:hypothetical protein
MNLNSNNDVAMEPNTTPPISPGDHEENKKQLSREEFVAQYTEASGSKKDAEMLANEIYKD